MQRFSTARGRQVRSQAETGDANVDISSADGDQSKSGSALALEAGATGGVLGTWQSLGPGNVGGRTRALIIDPTNPSVMYAAGVAGGIWKSTNGGASWSALDDFMANIAVTKLYTAVLVMQEKDPDRDEAVAAQMLPFLGQFIGGAS